jgi:hypothetical protein
MDILRRRKKGNAAFDEVLVRDGGRVGFVEIEGASGRRVEQRGGTPANPRRDPWNHPPSGASSLRAKAKVESSVTPIPRALPSKIG